MFENRHDTEIAGTSEQVWAVLTDLGRYAEWNPTIRRACGDLRVGGDVRFAVGDGSSQRQWTVQVVLVEPGREFAWTFHETMPVLFRGEHTFRVEPIDQQHTRYVDRETFAGLYVPVRRRRLATQYKAGMIAMGQALEHRVESLDWTGGALEGSPSSAPRTWLPSNQVREIGRAPTRDQHVGPGLSGYTPAGELLRALV